jgi:SAM-dependent methyltransferase
MLPGTAVSRLEPALLSVHRYHEISESSHRILNPLPAGKLHLLGEICCAGATRTVLDLACGKGELLCTFAEHFGAGGVGIDIHLPFVEVARARAAELGVADAVSFVEGDAGRPQGLGDRFDVVCCIGATWIGGGLAGTVALMRERLAPGGWILVGEPYWTGPAPAVVRKRYEDGQTFADLAGTLDRFATAELDLVEMVLASLDDWDRYAASQWLNVSDWLAANPDDPDAAELRERRDASRRAYLARERGLLGWGVFVLRPLAP